MSSILYYCTFTTYKTPSLVSLSVLILKCPFSLPFKMVKLALQLAVLIKSLSSTDIRKISTLYAFSSTDASYWNRKSSLKTYFIKRTFTKKVKYFFHSKSISSYRFYLVYFKAMNHKDCCFIKDYLWNKEIRYKWRQMLLVSNKEIKHYYELIKEIYMSAVQTLILFIK